MVDITFSDFAMSKIVLNSCNRFMLIYMYFIFNFLGLGKVDFENYFALYIEAINKSPGVGCTKVG